jgi:hypothetical protein
VNSDAREKGAGVPTARLKVWNMETSRVIGHIIPPAMLNTTLFAAK